MCNQVEASPSGEWDSSCQRKSITHISSLVNACDQLTQAFSKTLATKEVSEYILTLKTSKGKSNEKIEKEFCGALLNDFSNAMPHQWKEGSHQQNLERIPYKVSK